MPDFNVKTVQKVFRVLYSDIRDSFHACRSNNLGEPKIVPVDSWVQLPLPKEMRNRMIESNNRADDFFPKKIQHYILNEQSISITYDFKVGERKVVLHFVVFNKLKNSLNMHKMQEHARRVCALVQLVSLHAARSTCSSILNIFIYMTPFKKRLPDEQGDVFESEHANTGLSYHCAKNNEVVVYRKEEWFKVLIHELFHAMGLSFIESDIPAWVDAAMQTLLQNMYAISHSVRIYETYCETWARILNVMFECFTDGDSSHYGSPEESEFELAVFGECVMKGLRKDAKFALHQCAKIIHHMGIRPDVLLNPTDENRAIVAKKYRENTNVFAYYVLTCVLQNSPELFLQWCYKNNPFKQKKPRANVMQFRTIPSNFNGFMEMLNDCKQHCPPIVQSHGLDSSMRMTSHSSTE
jgi:hypothetical protein